jgi:hypothetical protein
LVAVEGLIREGANVNEATSGGGVTGLQLSSQLGHGPVVQLLLGIGADMERPDKSGYTALMLACAVGHWAVVELLVSSGASVNAVSTNASGLMVPARSFCWSPLFIAASRGHHDVVKALIASGRLDRLPELLSICLIVAARGAHDRVCLQLLSIGADLYAKSVWKGVSRTAGQVAFDHTHFELAIHLDWDEEHGAMYEPLRCLGPPPSHGNLLLRGKPSHPSTEVWKWRKERSQWLTEGGIDTLQSQWLDHVMVGTMRAEVLLIMRKVPLPTHFVEGIMAYVRGSDAVKYRELESALSTDTRLPLDAYTLAVEATTNFENGRRRHDENDMQETVAEGLAERLAPIKALLKQAEDGGCEWLRAYCDFLIGRRGKGQ